MGDRQRLRDRATKRFELARALCDCRLDNLDIQENDRLKAKQKLKELEWRLLGIRDRRAVIAAQGGQGRDDELKSLAIQENVLGEFAKLEIRNYRRSKEVAQEADEAYHRMEQLLKEERLAIEEQKRRIKERAEEEELKDAAFLQRLKRLIENRDEES